MKLKKTRSMKILSCFLLLVLSAAIALTAVGCDDKNDGGANTAQTTTVATTSGTTADPSTIRGEGNTEFIFKVVTASGEEKTFTVRTDKEKVGEALVDAGLIAGEDGPYGLYVKTVDGETVDYETHGKYWAFYVDGAYAPTGVDVTKIEAGREYSFRAEKG